MTRFDILTIFPEIFDSYFSESIIKRAQNKRLVKIGVHNLRDWATDKHKTVDNSPFGGGPGMVMMVGPIFKAVTTLKKAKSKRKKIKTILFSAKGKKFDQKMAQRFSKLDQLIMICGRYEGVDERVATHIADYEVSVGDYILTGGELPAMIVVDAVSRLIPGVIKEESIEEKRFPSSGGAVFLERGRLSLGSYPVYTRPETFSPQRSKNWNVPKVLLSGDHKKIEEWRRKHI